MNKRSKKWNNNSKDEGDGVEFLVMNIELLNYIQECNKNTNNLDDILHKIRMYGGLMMTRCWALYL